jgi:hypothetical protein
MWREGRLPGLNPERDNSPLQEASKMVMFKRFAQTGAGRSNTLMAFRVGAQERGDATLAPLALRND